RVGARPARALARADLLLNGLSVHLDEDERPVGILAKHPDRGPDGSGATVQALPETPRRRLSTPASGDLVLVLLEAFAGEDPEDLVRPSDPAPLLRGPFDDTGLAKMRQSAADRHGCASHLLLLQSCFHVARPDVVRSPGFNRGATDHALTLTARKAILR